MQYPYNQRNLNILEEKYNHSIDIEFAHDGESLYLLQCRSQSNSIDYKPADIPEDLPKEKMVFMRLFIEKYDPIEKIYVVK